MALEPGLSSVREIGSPLFSFCILASSVGFLPLPLMDGLTAKHKRSEGGERYSGRETEGERFSNLLLLAGDGQANQFPQFSAFCMGRPRNMRGEIREK